MKSSILPDSVERMIGSPEHQARLAELRKTIDLRYADEMRSPGILHRWILRWRMNAAYCRERIKIEPSEYAV